MKASKKIFATLLALSVSIMTALSFAACREMDPDDKDPDDNDSVTAVGAFDEQTTFYLDTADVQVFGAFIADNTITFETDGTFSNQYDFTAAGAVAGSSVFPDYDGEYKLNEDKTQITFTEPWKGTGNQSYTEEVFNPEKIKEIVCDIETLDDGSMKFVRIFNETLEMPYYSNPEQFDSLKEFEYPAELGEKIVFDTATNFVADVKNVPVSETLGTLSGLIIEFYDDGSFLQSLTLKGEDGTENTLTTEGAYKLDDKDAPTKLILLPEGGVQAEYVLQAVEDYFTLTYTSEEFGSVTLYSDVDKIPVDGPAADWPSDLLGTLEPFDSVTKFMATTAYGDAVFTFNKDGSAALSVLGMDFPLFYNLNEAHTKITIVDGGNKQDCDISVNQEGLMQFTYIHATAGSFLVTEQAAAIEPAEGWPSELLGELHAFASVTKFSAMTALGEAVFTFNADGSANLNALTYDFPLFYTLNAEGTQISIVDDGAKSDYAITKNGDGLMQFTYEHASLGDILVTEQTE